MLKDEATHLTLSVIAGVLIGALTGNYWAIAWAIGSGFLIDVDHLFDYLLFKKFKNLNLKEFFSGTFFDKSGKVILPLHGYEYGVVLIILGLVYINFNWLYLALGVSLIFHLIYDTISNKPSWPTYFVFYRLFYRFDHNDFDFKKGKKDPVAKD
jgi:hypothetical protein